MGGCTLTKPVILVCGGRDFSDQARLATTLDKICVERGWILEPDEYGNFLPDVFLIHGGARGADIMAEDWAIGSWCDWEVYEADWTTHGKKAGPIRNQEMLDKGKPNLVVAFPTPNSVGTWDMIKRARKDGVEVIVID